MNKPYRIFGAEASPYSVKVRSYFRYKAIPHEWVVRRMDRMAEFSQYAKLPLVPLVVCPDDSALQDSTLIIERMEERFVERSIVPEGAVAPFISQLIEEFADEWCNKPMFHYRWWYPADQQSGALRIAQDLVPEGAPPALAQAMVAQVKGRMMPRLSLVGSSEETRSVIEGSYVRLLELLEAHLTARSYLFGARPVLADFGLWGQLYQLCSDPTPGALMRERAPHVVAYVARMLDPEQLGELAPWPVLEPSLMPLLREQIAGLFLPWSSANAQALGRGDKLFSLPLQGQAFAQEPQRYHAKSLAVLKKKYAQAKSPELTRVLDAADITRWL